MRRKKKGSTLITIVIVSSLILTVGAAMLTMTLGDYRMRINESDRIQNLYGSESGLDGAYNIIVKTFDGAVRYGVLKVDVLKNVEKDMDKDEYKFVKQEEAELSPNAPQYISNLNNILSLEKQLKEENTDVKSIRNQIKNINQENEDLLNDEFKRCFRNFIYVEDGHNQIGDDEDKEDSMNLLKSSIDENKYVDNLSDIESIKKDKISFNYVELKQSDNKAKVYIPPMVKDDIDDSDTGIMLSSDKNSYKITVRSVFETDTDKVLDKSVGKNTKKVENIYNMTVPEYKDVTFSESNANTVNIPELNDEKVMIVGQNMSVDKALNFEITGDVYVYGKTGKEGSTLFKSKYDGGINLQESKGQVTGNIMTPKTINSGNNVEITIDGNTYCKNIYVGNKNTGKEKVKGSNLTISGDAVVDNDIASKADNSTLSIGSFYGINDKNIINKDDGLEKRASSIIVNDSKNEKNGSEEIPTIEINENAYIYGVSIIDTSEPYITGESTGVKGNYIAYANVVDPENDKFKYYDPLQLLEIDEGNEVEKKADHFKNYWSGDRKADSGGIWLPDNTKAIGAVVHANGTTSGFNWDSDADDKISEKQEEYAKYVYSLIADNNNKYDVLKEPINLVSDLFDVKNISSDYNVVNEQSKKEKAIFSKGNIVIKRSGNGKCSINEDEMNNITIETVSDGELNAVIVAEGDVTIDGDVDFKGTIITKGNLNINSSSKFMYDKNLIQRIQAANSDVFEGVFNSAGNIIENSLKSSSEEIIINYDLSKFLKTIYWKIIKDEKSGSNA
ncbi:DUF2572 family protein [Clostridium butyricum]|uniref:DUF2572 family protein n=1 Tax=Clostridium butyricum TaxID=1492 RepID=A0A6L9EMK7_CLOBU|nr:DUF2572 family protein [Clostridium butyricum]